MLQDQARQEEMESHRLTRVQTPLERPEITELTRGEGRREHRWVQLQRGAPSLSGGGAPATPSRDESGDFPKGES